MPLVITSAVSASTDDAHQHVDDVVEVALGGLQNNDVGEFIGIRFQSLAIPVGSSIISAKLSLTVAGDGSKNDTEGAWFCQAHDNAPTFTTTTNDIGARTLTTATVAWTVNDIGAGGAIIQTPDLATCVQEVTNRAGWVSGNSIVFVYAHNSAAEFLELSSFDHATDQEPRLEIRVAPKLFVTRSNLQLR